MSRQPEKKKYYRSSSSEENVSFREEEERVVVRREINVVVGNGEGARRVIAGPTLQTSPSSPPPDTTTRTTIDQQTVYRWKKNIIDCVTSRFSGKTVFIEVYIIASCIFQLSAYTRARALELVGVPFNNAKGKNSSYGEIRVPESSRRTFEHFRKNYSKSNIRINAKSLLSFVIDTMQSTPILVSSNFVSLFSHRRNKILNSIISFESLGKTCYYGDCNKIASVVVEEKIKKSKKIFCMQHGKLFVVTNDCLLTVEEEEGPYDVRLYHPYMLSLTCELESLTASIYRMESSIHQHDVSSSSDAGVGSVKAE